MNKDAKQYLTAILEGIVGSPESMNVDQANDEMGVLLTVSISKEDMGKVIGKEGETAKSIRRLLKVFGLTRRQNVSMKILEPA